MAEFRVGTESARAERTLSAIRGVALLLALPLVAMTTSYPNGWARLAAWGVLLASALGALAIWLVSRRALDEVRQAQLKFLALVYDVVAVSAFVLVFAYEDPNVTWVLLVVLPVDGALRYGWRGAVVVALISEVVFVGHSVLREAMLGESMSASAHFFVVALLALVGGVNSLLVEAWQLQSMKYREQAVALERAHQIRDRLMAVTSHEIRGSLAAIGTSAAVLQDQRHRLSEERVDRMLGATRKQAEHLLVLVDDLLVTGRGDERGLDLVPAWGDLESTVNLAVSAAQRSRQDHLVDVEGVEAIWCELDHQRVQQVVRNLVENAFKYSPAGSTVTVTTRRVPVGVELTVADQGTGIAAEQQAGLFEPFRRGENVGSTKGVGLGLYVVSRIVSAASGTITVDAVQPAPGGTRFVVTLPCSTEPVGTDLAGAQRRTGE
ncbi:MAG: sensor histidine kinase [Nocardioidaceae bacterium]